ncbi:MAG: N-acetylmuramoyl-L-alanine amidase [Hahellaceae bacterium]|nr:N-acetylmuramoyl-L-alanine amidase [Hahellaceae bacterium]
MLRLFCGLAALLWAAGAWAGAMTSVRVQESADHVRLVMELSQPAEHKVFTMSQPHRVVVDLEQTQLKANLGAIKSGTGGIRNIRSGVRGQGGLRLVFDVDSKVSTRSFALKPEGRAGHRLVIDLYPAEKRPVVKQSVSAASKPSGPPRDIIVVVDPGHGGQDPGALGPNGVREKDVVLNISRELVNQINAKEGFKARLTRNSDVFIPLRKRTDIARDHNADLLVSVHADAFNNPKANGASVFALSKNGATSETAKWLAERENKSDLIGGMGGVNLDDKDQVLAGVLLDLSMTASMNASVDVGDRVLRSLGRVNRLHKRRVEKAGFVVLKSPDIPSILVETGFISNPGEAQKLTDLAHQRSLASAVSNGLVEYFSLTPPPGTLLAARKKLDGISATYKAAKGDTLSAIAARNNISLSDLMRANGLTQETLFVGQVLVIPTS